MRQKALGLALALVLLAVALPTVWRGITYAWADASSLRARWTIAEWRDGKGPQATAEVWNQVRDDLLAAAQVAPGNAQWYDDLGYLHASRGEAMPPQPEGSPVWNYQRTLYSKAEGYFTTSTALRPTFPYSWGYLALTKHVQGKHDDSFWQAFDKAYRYGNAEAGVQPVLARMAFDLWPELGAERKARIASMIDTAQPAAGKALQAMAAKAKVALP